jgi:hypothetical protein
MVVDYRRNYEVSTKYFYIYKDGEGGTSWDYTGLLEWENALLYNVRRWITTACNFYCARPSAQNAAYKVEKVHRYF